MPDTNPLIWTWNCKQTALFSEDSRCNASGIILEVIMFIVFVVNNQIDVSVCGQVLYCKIDWRSISLAILVSLLNLGSGCRLGMLIDQ